MASTTIADNTHISQTGYGFTLAATGDQLNLIAGFSIGTTASGYTGIFSTASNLTMNLDGNVFGDNAIYLTGGSANDHVIVGTHGSLSAYGNAIAIVGSGDTVVNNGEIVSSNDDAISLGASSAVTNNGFITGQAVGIVGTGGMVIVNNGTITSVVNNAIMETDDDNLLVNYGTVNSNDAVHYGVDFLFSGNTVTNTGTIHGGAGGVYFNAGGGDNYLNNSGTISGDKAVDFGLGGGRITNDGHLDGIVDLGAGVAHLLNTGTIAGDIVTKLGAGHGNDTVVNKGTIDGSLTFSAASTYDGQLGSITGAVNGGAGSDKLAGGADNDTLAGNNGNDVLKGGGGDDMLTGGLGKDKLAGGDGDNTFVYGSVTESKSGNYDTIVGFDAAHDTIQTGLAINAVLTASGTLDSGASFTSELATILNGAHLPAHDATVVTASAGSLGGHTFLVIDANGQAGYQAAGDYVIQLSHSVDAALTIDNFS